MWRVSNILLLMSLFASSANGVITFERVYGGAEADGARSVCITPDGGYVAAGYTKSLGPSEFNFCAVKTDSLGNEQWLRSYGGDERDQAFSLDRASGGGYVMAGLTNSFGATSCDFWIVKVDEQGNEVWAKKYGSGSHDEAYYVEETSDGGLIVTGGYKSFDLCLFKLNSGGDSVWLHMYGSSTAWEVGHCIRQVAYKGYVVAGYTTSEGAGGRDVWLLGTDSLCNTKFRECFGGSEDDEARFVEETSDSGYIATGYTKSSGAGQKDVLLLKVDSLGNEEWSKTYGGSLNDEGHCVRQTFDGGYVVVGYTESHGAGSADVWLLKTDSSGELAWARTHGGTGGEMGHSVQQTSDGGYILSGYTGSYGAGVVDIYLVKTDEDGLIGVEEATGHEVRNPGLSVFPNPAGRSVTLNMTCNTPVAARLALHDAAGRKLETLFAGTFVGDKRIALDASPGVYFVRMETEAGVESLKLISLH